MACEKYSALIADAAFGALAQGREPEFMAHAAGCDACREAYQHAREVAAFVDRGVQSLVSGEPSPHFIQRIRARIAAEPVPTRFHLVGWAHVAPPRRLAPLAVGALVFGALLLVLLAHSLRHNNQNPAMSIAAQHQPPLPQAIALNPPPHSTAIELPPASHEHYVIRRAAPHSSEPEVLVQPGQFAAVLRYADVLHSGRIDGGQLMAAQPSLDKPLEMAPIEIPLIGAPKKESDAANPTENSSRP